MIADPSPADALPLRLYRDHLYIEATIFEAHLSHVRSIALLREGTNLVIMPIAHEEAGGFYIKQVNARGDRAIHAADFFRLNAIDDTLDMSLDAWPNASIAGFIIYDFFLSAN
jgi:hypothetical protein